MRSIRKAALASTFGLCVAAVAAQGFAQPSRSRVGEPRIHLRGSAHAKLHFDRGTDGVVISGAVADDADVAVAKARVVLGISRPGAGSTFDAGAAIPLATTAPRPCDASERLVLEASTRLVLSADTAGRFCLKLLLPAGRYVARVETQESLRYEPETNDVGFDAAGDAVMLQLEPERTVWSLDDPENTVEVAAWHPGTAPKPAAGLAVVLSNELGIPLGEATTDADGRARFRVSSEMVGAPGMTVVRASVPDNPNARPSAGVVEKRTGVTLAILERHDESRFSGLHSRSIGVRMIARADCSKNGCNAIPTGVIEALVGDTVVGAGPVIAGEANVDATISSRDSVLLAFRYVPNVPWFRPIGSLQILVSTPGRSARGRLATILAALLALASFVVVRLPNRHERKAAATIRRRRDGRGMASREAPPTDWQGRVVDAHDETGVAHAVVKIERPLFLGSETVRSTTCDERGRFVLPHADLLPGDRIVAQGELHVSAESAAPPAGRIELRLVLRRREIVRQLLAWTSRPSGPSDVTPEATPSDIRRAAGADSRIGRWAEAVERAAFGPEPVDARRQHEVDRLAPDAPTADRASSLESR